MLQEGSRLSLWANGRAFGGISGFLVSKIPPPNTRHQTIPQLEPSPLALVHSHLPHKWLAGPRVGHGWGSGMPQYIP